MGLLEVRRKTLALREIIYKPGMAPRLEQAASLSAAPVEVVELSLNKVPCAPLN